MLELPRRRETRPLWIEVFAHLDARYGGIATSAPRSSIAAASAGGHRSAMAALCLPDETAAGVPGTIDRFPLGRLNWLSSPSLRRRFEHTLAPADAYHIHGLWQEHCSMTARHARTWRKPYVVSAHGMLDAWALRHKGFKKRVYAALGERRNLSGAACLRALTATELDDFRRFGLSNPVAIIPNGVDIPEVGSDDFYERFPDLQSKRVVLYMGRLHQKKGLLLLCRAWESIHRAFPDAHLVIAGPDSENTSRDVLRLVAERGLEASVSMPGMLEPPLTWAALRAAEVFVLPSFSEGMSRAVLEAMGCGVPVITSHACNFPEVTQHDCGLVIEPEERALAGALSDMLGAPQSELQRMGRNGERLVHQRFSWDVVGRQMAAVYGWVLGGGPKPAEVRIDLGASKRR